ncbi:Maturation and nuclear export of 40S ribosomal subunits interacting protein [Blastocladiella emersonii ATCC 22665]|nr:Maturation and nuclear export of 40S ribosomal subunits interacting protein [Blastocladiella emersonii ATCC 22665]
MKPSSLPQKPIGKSDASRKSKEEITTLVDEVRALERSVTVSKANINNLVKVLKFAAAKHPHRVIHAALHSMQRLFAHFRSTGALDKAHLAGADPVAMELCKWLRKHHAAYLERLMEVVDESNDTALQVAASKLLIDVTIEASRELNKTSASNVFDNVLFVKVVHATFLKAEWSPVYTRDYLQLYKDHDDLRYYLFKNLTKLIQTEMDAAAAAAPAPAKGKRKRDADDDSEDESGHASNLARLAEHGLLLLEALDKFPTSNADLKSFLVGRELVPAGHQIMQASAHKRAFTDFVLQYLRLPLTQDLYKKVLMLTNSRLIPNMTDPRLLMTFLSESYDQGGSISLLALHSVFTLVVKHNLDYPDFYKKLYQLFDRNLFHVKYRSRFFRLFNQFMQSTHIPAYLVAAFVKKMSRLALYAPPAGVLITLPLVYNLIKQHPQCFALIHRTDVDLRNDPFDMDAEDPAESKALESSLWEVVTLQKHYFPNVATMSKIFTQKLSKPGYELEDFLDYTYGNLFETVHVPVLKKAPALSDNIAPTLFPADGSFGSLFDL